MAKEKLTQITEKQTHKSPPSQDQGPGNKKFILIKNNEETKEFGVKAIF